MNIAVIFAGGVGHRMGAEIPKQLLKVNGKPIIIYTLEQFSNHPEIDAIIVVFKEEYIDELNSLLIQWNIGKVVEVTKGGATGQESIYLGLQAASEKAMITANKQENTLFIGSASFYMLLYFLVSL